MCRRLIEGVVENRNTCMQHVQGLVGNGIPDGRSISARSSCFRQCQVVVWDSAVRVSANTRVRLGSRSHPQHSTTRVTRLHGWTTCVFSSAATVEV